MAMRVVGGTARSVPLVGPSSERTRPITDRAKEALFNILGDRVVEAEVLDLFAGTGAVGVEALSRGAAGVTFVERDREAVADIEANLAKTRLGDDATIHRGDAFSFVRSASRPFDIVYSGPPQWDGLWASMLEALDAAAGAIMASGAIVVTQLDPREDDGDPDLGNLARLDTRDYGRVRLVFHGSPVA